MEFDFDVSLLFDSDIVKLNCQSLGGDDLSCNRRTSKRDVASRFTTVINEMGRASAKAQGLHHTITTYNKILESDQTLYLMKDDFDHDICLVVGILKVGRKKLFLQDPLGRMHEMVPICVLDFYIHETYQRKGCGLKLFEYMLKDQNVMAYELAIDRPSVKLLGFMKKHYSHLGEPVHQRNNFTVYNNIFSAATVISDNDDYKFGDVSKRRLRNSDQFSAEDSNHSHWSRSLHRHSFPKYDDLSSSCSSVASVVFGQRLSQAYEEKAEDPSINSLKRRTVHEESGQRCSDTYQAVDSSMNIFGVPSPPNRYRLT